MERWKECVVKECGEKSVVVVDPGNCPRPFKMGVGEASVQTVSGW